MNVAVIGAGWAGLSAAHTLKQAGCAVTVYESGHQPGGRARSVQSPNLSNPVDNGQHILLGAYTETLALMQSCGVDATKHLHRESLYFGTPNNTFRLRLPRFPGGRAGMLLGLLGALGLSWQCKYYLTRALYQLERKHWKISPDTPTLSQWLRNQKQTPGACKYFWHPLCLAALNTHPDEADAQIMANVLKDSLGNPDKGATDVLIANDLLASLWPTQVCRSLNLHLSTPIRRMRRSKDGFCLNDRYEHAAVILATPAHRAKKLLADLPKCNDGTALHTQLSAFEHRPIATLWIELTRPWESLPVRPMLMLEDDPKRHAYGQWLFNHAHIKGSRNPHLLAMVTSDASALGSLPREKAVRYLLNQLATETDHACPMPTIRGHTLVIEKRATFAATPNLSRPAIQTPWRGLWLAGDWTDTGYPAVLEGAVRSGLAAAKQLLAGQVQSRL